MPTSSEKVIYYFEDSDPQQPDEALLKKMKKAELLQVIRIMAERWKSDTEQSKN